MLYITIHLLLTLHKEQYSTQEKRALLGTMTHFGLALAYASNSTEISTSFVAYKITPRSALCS